ncbi:hypothetical protein KP79_PYT11585 [Mizuhopecten yessoensis]|uniref:Uncharacterized protein n=1 Tax=Mizuhopecten yessoensis TaxID=6573 RepID=A0A210PPP1_MIZYE|nr:hypothetical protein KP79_PYT11585 [Mizuhopecten yessoensis]
MESSMVSIRGINRRTDSLNNMPASQHIRTLFSTSILINSLQLLEVLAVHSFRILSESMDTLTTPALHHLMM